MDDYGFVRGDIRADYANAQLPYRALATNFRRRPLEDVTEDDLINDMQELRRRFSQSKRGASQPPPEMQFYNPFTKQRECFFKFIYGQVIENYLLTLEQGGFKK